MTLLLNCMKLTWALNEAMDHEHLTVIIQKYPEQIFILYDLQIPHTFFLL